MRDGADRHAQEHRERHDARPAQDDRDDRDRDQASQGGHDQQRADSGGGGAPAAEVGIEGVDVADYCGERREYVASWTIERCPHNEDRDDPLGDVGGKDE